MKIYDYRTVENFIRDKLVPAGYEIFEIPGCLVDSYICIAPGPNYYHVIFREKYLNEWSSGLTMRRYQKLPAWALDAIESLNGGEQTA